MAIAATLARLNSKSNIFDPLPPGGIPEITTHDIAAAIGMAKIPKGAAYLLRVKWARQHEYLSDLTACLYTACSDERDYDVYTRKRSHYPGLVFDLTRMAVAEYCITSHICLTCQGRKEAVVNAKKVKCGGCGGSGLKNAGITRQELIEQFLKVPKSTFYNAWSRLYDDLMDLQARWEQVGLGAVHGRIYGHRN